MSLLFLLIIGFLRKDSLCQADVTADCGWHLKILESSASVVGARWWLLLEKATAIKRAGLSNFVTKRVCQIRGVLLRKICQNPESSCAKKNWHTSYAPNL